MATSAELEKTLSALSRAEGEKLSPAQRQARVQQEMTERLETIRQQRTQILGEFALFMHRATTDEMDAELGVELEIVRSGPIETEHLGTGRLISMVTAFGAKARNLHRDELLSGDSSDDTLEGVEVINVFRPTDHETASDLDLYYDEQFLVEIPESGPYPLGVLTEYQLSHAEFATTALAKGLEVFTTDAANEMLNPDIAARLR